MSDTFRDKPDQFRNDKAVPPVNAPPVSAQTKMVVMLLVAVLHRDPDQPRKEFDHAKLVLLGKSLRKHQDYPLVVYRHPTLPDHYMVVDGERRLRAALLEGLTHLACLVIEKPESKLELRKLQVRTNLLRESMNAYELAAALREMMQAGLTQAQLAEELDVAPSTLSRYLSIRRLAPDLKPHVESGDVGQTVAQLIASVEKLDDQRALMKRAIGPPAMTKEEVQRAVDVIKGRKEKKARPIKGKTPSGCPFQYTPKKGMTGEQIMEDFKAILAVIRKYLNLPPDAWGHLFNGNS